MSYGFITVKRNHDLGNSYERQHSFGACLPFQRFVLLASWWELKQLTGTCGKLGTENFTSGSQTAGKAHLLQQGNTSLNKATHSKKVTFCDSNHQKTQSQKPHYIYKQSVRQKKVQKY